MHYKDTLYTAVTAIALIIHINTVYITHNMEKPSILAKSMKDDGKVTPPKKQQKLLSLYATFLQILSSISSDKTKKANSPVKRNQLLVDYEKRINTLTQIPVDIKDKQINDGYLKELDRFVIMAECNELICLPNENICIELSSLQSQLKEVMSKNSSLKDFFSKTASLQSEI